MKSIVRWMLLVICAVALLATSTPANAVTVGEFLQSTARAVGVTPASADGLRSAGYEVPLSDLQRPLTEADVVAVAGALGIPLNTLDPGAAVSDRRMTRIVSYFESSSREDRTSADGKSRPDPKRRPRSGSPRVPRNRRRPHSGKY